MTPEEILERIQDYQRRCEKIGDSGPLIFSKNQQISLGGLSLDKAVIRCLELMEKYPSIDQKTGYQETRNGADRSAIDIWRHLQVDYPEVTLPEVMQTMYKIRRKLNGHYCYVVKRRVFFLKSSSFGILFDSRFKDEYGLKLRHWSLKGD